MSPVFNVFLPKIRSKQRFRKCCALHDYITNSVFLLAVFVI